MPPCALCQDFAPSRTHIFILCTAFDELNVSADNGCQMCDILRRGLYNCFPQAKERGSIRLNMWISDLHPKRRLFGKIYGIQLIGTLEVDVFVAEGKTCPWKGIPTGNPILGDTKSNLSFERCQAWISQCISRHNCSATVQARSPTRVLDISGLKVQLVETNGSCASYACLSHRWGSEPQLSTTRANYEQHRVHISWTTLPKTFQDAIEFTRRLGLTRIWIDSLCIVQDDEEDWNKEAHNMANIYKHAFITLSASVSIGGGSGMHSTIPVCTIKGTNTRGEDFEIHFRQTPKHISYEFQPESFPLLKRGWVYQERLLSPRIIHFGPGELSWECNESEDCECGIGSFGPRKALKAEHRECLESKDQKIIQKRWRQIVSEYSFGELTRGSDRLIGIAGVADDVGTYRSDRYLVGLWEDSLILDLLWAPFPSPSVDDVEEKQAPSWSWACSDRGQIWYFPPGMVILQQFAQVLGVDCRHVSPTVTVGSVVITSKMIKIPYPKDSLGSDQFTKVIYEDFFNARGLQEHGLLYGLLMVRTDDSEISLLLKRRGGSTQYFERVGLLKVFPNDPNLADWNILSHFMRKMSTPVGYENAEDITVVIV